MKKNYIVLFLSLIFLMLIFSVSFAANPAVVSVFTRMDRQVYHSQEEVILEIMIRNRTLINVEFDVYDSSREMQALYTTFQPVVFDFRGREAELIVPYKQSGTSVGDILIFLGKRRIVLAPDELFTVRVDLRKLYNLDINRDYRVKGFFIPDIHTGVMIESANELRFRIEEFRHPVRKQDNNQASRDLCPTEIIMLHLTAERERNWPNFLKYLKIEKYIETYPEYMGDYLRADNLKKSAIEREFIKGLSRQRDDYLLDFRIKGLEIDEDIAYVEVYVNRFGPRLNRTYRYRYTLERQEESGIVKWLIIYLEATFIKGGMK